VGDVCTSSGVKNFTVYIRETTTDVSLNGCFPCVIEVEF
jgi:hypothetical protein